MYSPMCVCKNVVCLQGSYRQVSVKFKHSSRTSRKDFPTVFKD